MKFLKNPRTVVEVPEDSFLLDVIDGAGDSGNCQPNLASTFTNASTGIRSIGLSRRLKGLPDNAYFLLLCTCVAAYLTAAGAILTFVAFYGHSQEPSLGIHMFSTSDGKAESHHWTAAFRPSPVLGPSLLAIGGILFAVVGTMTVCFGCEGYPRFVQKWVLRKNVWRQFNNEPDAAEMI